MHQYIPGYVPVEQHVEEVDEANEVAEKLLDILEDRNVTIALTPAMREQIVCGLRDIRTVLA